MVFEIGKSYKHTTGKEMTIIGELETKYWGFCLIGETSDCELIPVGRDEESAINWSLVDQWRHINYGTNCNASINWLD